MRLSNATFSSRRTWPSRHGRDESSLDTITMWIVILLAVATLAVVSGAFLSLL